MDKSCLIDGVAQIACFESIFARIISIVTILAGLVFFIMLLVGGMRYLFSAGNPKTVEAAKGTLTTAFLGLALIVGAYLILRIVAVFTGLNELLIFKIVGF